MKNEMISMARLLAMVGLVAAGCSPQAAVNSRTFTVGDTSSSRGGLEYQCSITDNGDGSATIACRDGSAFTLQNGTQCTVFDNGDGSSTISCDDGTAATITDGQDGKDGDDGQDGHSALVRLDDEPAGTNCADGGVAIQSGIDTDADGTLADAEITATKYVCHGKDSGFGSAVLDANWVIVSTSTDAIALQAFSAITGSLTISTGTNPHCIWLDLPNLTSIGGDLRIQQNGDCASVPKLPNLVHVGGSLRIENNDELASLEGLVPSLTKVGGDLRVHNNPTLPSLAGLESITTVGGDLSIGSANHDTLSGLEGITTVGGSVTIGATGAYVYAVSRVSSLSGLDNLVSVAGDLRFGNVMLQSLSALGKLAGSIRGIYVTNTYLNDLSGLDGITSVDQALEITDNKHLTSFTGLEGITSVGSLVLSENSQWGSIPDLSGLANLVSVNGDLVIFEPKLRDLNLGKLETIAGSAQIQSARLNLDLGSLVSVAGDLSISSYALPTIALPALSSVGKALSISNSWGLTTVKLDALASVGAGLSVGLTVSNNPDLSSLSLASLSTLGSQLSIFDNPKLPTCMATALHDQLVLAGWTGTATIYGNSGAASCP